MSNDPFANSDPFTSAGNFEPIIPLYGRLLLVTPTEHVFGIKTQFATDEKPTTDAIDAEVIVLDDPDGVRKIDTMRFFQGPLIGTLKAAAKFNSANPAGDPRTGQPKMILGRLGKGEDKTKRLTEALYFTDADKRAWIFTPPSDADKQTARDYLNNVPKAEPPNPFEV